VLRKVSNFVIQSLHIRVYDFDAMQKQSKTLQSYEEKLIKVLKDFKKSRIPPLDKSEKSLYNLAMNIGLIAPANKTVYGINPGSFLSRDINLQIRPLQET
jgi:hypothetical protein